MNRRIMFSSNGLDWGRKISNSRGLTLLGVQIAVSQFQIVLFGFLQWKLPFFKLRILTIVKPNLTYYFKKQ